MSYTSEHEITNKDEKWDDEQYYGGISIAKWKEFAGSIDVYDDEYLGMDYDDVDAALAEKYGSMWYRMDDHVRDCIVECSRGTEGYNNLDEVTWWDVKDGSYTCTEEYYYHSDDDDDDDEEEEK